MCSDVHLGLLCNMRRDNEDTRSTCLCSLYWRISTISFSCSVHHQWSDATAPPDRSAPPWTWPTSQETPLASASTTERICTTVTHHCLAAVSCLQNHSRPSPSFTGCLRQPEMGTRWQACWAVVEWPFPLPWAERWCGGLSVELITLTTHNPS
jgi:hypothetical protein